MIRSSLLLVFNWSNMGITRYDFYMMLAYSGLDTEQSIISTQLPINPFRLILFGRSIGNPKARSQINCTRGPSARLTPKVTV